MKLQIQGCDPSRLQALLLSLLISSVLAGCNTADTSCEPQRRVATNLARKTHADQITRLDYFIPHGEKGSPYIVAGLEKVLSMTNRHDICKMWNGLRSIPDGDMLVYGAGSIVHISAMDDQERMLASISCEWDGMTVLVGHDDVYFAGRSREFVMECFHLLQKIAPSYLDEVEAGKRPAPPFRFIRERFPFVGIGSEAGSDLVGGGDKSLDSTNEGARARSAPDPAGKP